jgi:hypothetical protein
MKLGDNRCLLRQRVLADAGIKRPMRARGNPRIRRIKRRSLSGLSGKKADRQAYES